MYVLMICRTSQLQLPRSIFWFVKVTEAYGPVFSLKQGSQLIVIISRYSPAIDIMEKEEGSLARRE